MSELNLTPGEWVAHKAKGADWYEIHYSTDGECVAEVVHDEADAKAMAAAKELLQACIALEAAQPDTWAMQAAQTAMRAAITKATT